MGPSILNPLKPFSPVSHLIELIEASDVKDLIEALGRPFFLGTVVYPSPDSPVYVSRDAHALSPEAVAVRLEDPRFCRFCFMGDGIHDYGCRKSPWNI